jgi:O-antigen/teichoic acid export membrane protein
MTGGPSLGVARGRDLRRFTNRQALAAYRATAVMGLGTGVRFLTQLALARWLGAAAFGAYVVARAWGEGLSVFPTRGYLLTVVQHLPGYRAARQWPEFRGLLRVSTLETALLGLGLAVSGAVVAWRIDAGVPVIVGLCLVPVVALSSLHSATLQSLNRYPTAMSIRELVQPIVLAGCVGLLVLADRVSPTSAIGAYLLSVLVALVLLALVVRRVLPPEVRSARPVNLRGQWVRTARPLYASQLGLSVLNIADVLVVGAVLGPAAAGVYAAAGRIAFLSQIIGNGAEHVAAAPISEAWARGDRRAVQAVVDQTIRVALPPTVLLTVLAVPLGEPVLGLLGDEFVAGRWVLLILLSGHIVTAMSGPIGFVVSMSGMHRTYAEVLLGHAAAGVVGAVVAASLGGIELVALSTALVSLSWNAWLVAIGYRQLGVRCWPRLASSKAQ